MEIIGSKLKYTDICTIYLTIYYIHLKKMLKYNLSILSTANGCNSTITFEDAKLYISVTFKSFSMKCLLSTIVTVL